MQTFHLDNMEKTEKAAYTIAELLPSGSIVAFYGDLGTGKTTFIKYLSHHLIGIDHHAISSPTFSLLNIYENGSKTIFHFDAYRIQSQKEFALMGFDEFFHQGFCFIEWAEKIENILPSKHIKITLSYSENEKRILTLDDSRLAL